MKNSTSGFTLIELLVVIAIVGILAAVAIVVYEGHKVRAKLVEVENAMAVVKGAVSAFREEREYWPDCSTINEVQNSLGVGLGSVTRISGMSITNGIITATIQKIDPRVNGQTLTLTPTLNSDGSFIWDWNCSPGIPMHLRPRPR